MRGRGDQVIRLVLVELAVVRGIGAGNDRLGLEHLHRHLVPPASAFTAPARYSSSGSSLMTTRLSPARHDLDDALDTRAC